MEGFDNGIVGRVDELAKGETILLDASDSTKLNCCSFSFLDSFRFFFLLS